MKKIFAAILLLGTFACKNPEDKAASDRDSSSFNSNAENNLNTPPGPTDPNSQTGKVSRDSAQALDTSVIGNRGGQ